jgi:hypothetical protein
MSEVDAVLQQVLLLENRHIAGEHTLASAYECLRVAWRSDLHDRELALHLAFLAWYSYVEPPNSTGLAESITWAELQSSFVEATGYLLPDGERSEDAEALYTVGLMAHLVPFFEKPEEWLARSVRYRAAYRKICPSGIDPKLFVDRGFYGKYFHGHAVLKNAY